jgi:GNAT superfamily N-acetyltransferase
MDEPQYTIRLFEKALHDRSAFSCGIKPIDTWLRKSVSDQIKNNRLRLWCATDSAGRLVGFYALNSHNVSPENAPALARKNDRHPIPAVYLPVVAVASDLQGAGLGSALMGHAIQKAISISEEIAVAAIILDVFEDEHFERRFSFYSKIGFRKLGDDPKRLFLSIADARASAN